MQNEYGQISVPGRSAGDVAGKAVRVLDQDGRAPVRCLHRKLVGQKRGHARMDDAGDEACIGSLNVCDVGDGDGDSGCQAILLRLPNDRTALAAILRTRRRRSD